MTATESTLLATLEKVAALFNRLDDRDDRVSAAEIDAVHSEVCAAINRASE